MSKIYFNLDINLSTNCGDIFLVYAAVTSSEEKKKLNQKETRKEQHSHIEKKEG